MEGTLAFCVEGLHAAMHNRNLHQPTTRLDKMTMHSQGAWWGVEVVLELSIVA